MIFHESRNQITPASAVNAIPASAARPAMALGSDFSLPIATAQRCGACQGMGRIRETE
jgi:hypothetical protein